MYIYENFYFTCIPSGVVAGFVVAGISPKLQKKFFLLKWITKILCWQWMLFLIFNSYFIIDDKLFTEQIFSHTNYNSIIFSIAFKMYCSFLMSFSKQMLWNNEKPNDSLFNCSAKTHFYSKHVSNVLHHIAKHCHFYSIPKMPNNFRVTHRICSTH